MLAPERQRLIHARHRANGRVELVRPAPRFGVTDETIAQRAVQHIKPEDFIALDGSSTACEPASLLPDMPLTEVTNALPGQMLCSAVCE